jgi:replicative DNA helicase
MVARVSRLKYFKYYNRQRSSLVAERRCGQSSPRSPLRLEAPMPAQLQPPEDIRAALPVSSILPAVLEQARAARALILSGEATVGFPTGLPTIDRDLGGLQPGMHALAAEPGAGKTALALQIARHGAARGLPTVIVTFDETRRQLSLKVAASMAGMTASKIAQGRVDPEPLARAAEQHHDVLRMIEIIDGDGDLRPEDVVDVLGQKLAQHEARIGLLVVDYLQAWASCFQSTKSEFRQAIGDLVGRLRKAVIVHNCPMLIISAQNRDKRGEATLSSFAESSDIEYRSDGAYVLTHDKERMVSAPRVAVTLNIEKTRFGAVGVRVPLVLDGSTGVIGEAAR